MGADNRLVVSRAAGRVEISARDAQVREGGGARAVEAVEFLLVAHSGVAGGRNRRGAAFPLQVPGRRDGTLFQRRPADEEVSGWREGGMDVELGRGGRQRVTGAREREIVIRERSLRTALRRGELQVRRGTAVDRVVGRSWLSVACAAPAPDAAAEVRGKRRRCTRIEAVGHEERGGDDVAGRNARRVCTGGKVLIIL